MNIVRLGTSFSDEFLKKLNEKNSNIQEIFMKKITEYTNMISTKVMLGDGTVTEQKTFDPILTQNYFDAIIKKLFDWKVQQVSTSNNEDIRRIFVKFEVIEGNYLISVHLSIQFHVLLFYKPDNRVLEYQKELSGIIDKTKNSEKQIAELGDQYVLEKLKELGYKDLDYQNLFEIFFENDDLRDKIYNEINKKTDINLNTLTKRQKSLFAELDNLLIETYQSSPVLIDETRLVSGEEGGVCNIDLEFIKNKTKEGLFDPKKLSVETKNNIIKRLDMLMEIMKI
jgi:hypothetical protein